MDVDAPSKYVTLVSGDGFEFVVLRDAALVSPIIKGMLDVRSQFAEAQEARCVFQEMSPGLFNGLHYAVAMACSVD
ncbi:transcription elongation factor B polypeptide 1 [Fusarium albosuccineum]|uniref:Transcription elongation factor B polypeptide 1 n=1 Tax=Fusarium albosuccineum TaxID=1237068 RepID=A0A8H4KY41_9HYPO|nr:transcription elongation factor B polypeptide 1 [Fusarium albosuccineum]